MNWENKRAIIGLIEVAASSLQSAKAILPHHEDITNPDLRRLQKKVDDLRYQAQLLKQNIESGIYDGWDK